jgi:hypothetical protein
MIAVLVGLTIAACTGVQPAQTHTGALPESGTPAVAIGSPLAVPAGDADAIASPDLTSPSQWAFLHDHALYIHHNGQETLIEDCRDRGCQIYSMRWSPHGSYLFYYVSPAGLSIDRVPEWPTCHGQYKAGDEPPHIILRVADLHGRVRTLTDKATLLPPPPWSSYLVTVVHFEPGRLYGEDEPLFEEITYEDLIGWPTCHGQYETWQDRLPEIVDTEQFQYAPPPLELLDEFGPGVECGLYRQPHAATGDIED